MINDIEKIILDKETIERRVEELAQKITNDFKDKFPVIICILRGSVIFFSDLIKRIDTYVEIDFFSLSSYGNNSNSSGVVKIRKDIDTNIENRHVIVVEDIVESGLTLKYIFEYLEKHNPASLSICTLLNKPEVHQTDLKINYVGFNIENKFVVGYGLDYAERYRNLPYIGILKKEIYS
ncbi:MAG: hypoxanthine phosphoribosyltransferase [Candidatus Cloacimonetes bacterium]|nr:hypoxanthine phosphoribosyltransferase [Candidatus Cloacimonadota bacterium]